VPLIAQSYRILFRSGIDFFQCASDAAPADVIRLAREINETRPERLIFIDHAPHPGDLLSAISELRRGRPLPPIFFHVFGDFTLFTPQWRRIQSLLKGTPVSFICASNRQKALVSSFVRKGLRRVSQCPFSVDTKKFRFIPDLRRAARKKLGLSDSDFAIAYAGRMTLQKNIQWLIHAFGQFATSKSRRCVLFLAGPFDDLGAPFFVRPDIAGQYFFELERARVSLPKNLRDQVRYLGVLDGQALKDLYLAADVYASLSTHHDEDFGISPAEALCCGTPTVLTDWGGFPTFHDLSIDDVKLVGVRMRGAELEIDLRRCVAGFESYFSAGGEIADRRRRSAYFRNHLSATSAAKILSRIHQTDVPPFIGFSHLLERHADLWKRKPIFANDKLGVYRDVYQTYITLSQ